MVKFFFPLKISVYLLTLKTKKQKQEKKIPPQSKKDLVLAHGKFDAVNQCKSVGEENSESISFIWVQFSNTFYCMKGFSIGWGFFVTCLETIKRLILHCVCH